MALPECPYMYRSSAFGYGKFHSHDRRVDTFFALNIMHDVDVAFFFWLQHRSRVNCGNKEKVALHASTCHVNCWDYSHG